MTALAPDDPRHGKYSTYTLLRCRCTACRAANAEAARTRRATSSRARDSMRARSIAENKAASFVRHNHPAIWEQLLDDAYEQVGLVRLPTGRPRKGAA